MGRRGMTIMRNGPGCAGLTASAHDGNHTIRRGAFSEIP